MVSIIESINFPYFLFQNITDMKVTISKALWVQNTCKLRTCANSGTQCTPEKVSVLS